MMIADDIYILDALLVSNAFLLGAAAIAILRLQNLVQNSESFWNSPTGAAIRDADRSSDPIAEKFDERIASLQRVIDELSDRDRAAHSQKSGDLPFETAVRMAKHGAGIDDLIRSCGLSKVQAQLMMRVHAGTDKTASSISH